MGSLRINHFGTLAAHLEARVGAATQASAADLIADLVADMSAGKHGRQWPELPNRSSAPGESPAVQSQALAESLHDVPLTGTDRAVGTPLAYAADLEYGAPGRHLAARPFLVPGAHRVAPAHWAGLVRALVGKGAR